MELIDTSEQEEELIKRAVLKAARSRRFQKYFLRFLALFLIIASGYFIWNLIPRHYELKITGGNILGTRHYIAKMLSNEMPGKNVDLIIQPTKGSIEALEKIESGELDLAFVQGGLGDREYQNVQHVATLIPEVLHLLVRGDIESIADLKGKTVNLGSKKGGTRVIVEKVLAFSGLTPKIDYVVKNYRVEELQGMHEAKLPDAVFILSTPPSYAVEQLVRGQGYHLLEIPFPPALALRHGWVADEKILAYTYQVKPAEPAQDISSVGVNMHLVSNLKVKEEAIVRVLETLYSTSLGEHLFFSLDEERITIHSGYPMSSATVAYLNRDDSILSMQNLDELSSWFGMILSFITTILVFSRWLKEEDDDQEWADEEFYKYLGEVVSLEKSLHKLVAGSFRPKELNLFENELAALRIKVLSRYATVMLEDEALLEQVLTAIDGSRTYLMQIAIRYPEGKKS